MKIMGLFTHTGRHRSRREDCIYALCD